MLTKLPSGVEVVIRPIRCDDKDRLVSGLQRLSPEASRRRFLSTKTKFTADELRYLTEIDGVDHVAFVAGLAEDSQTLVAVARYVRLVDDPASAEAAIVISDELQGQGLGTCLGLLLADTARLNGIESFVATMHSDNLPAHKLFAKISARLESVTSYGVDELVAQLAA